MTAVYTCEHCGRDHQVGVFCHRNPDHRSRVLMPMPNPTEDDLASPLFEAIYGVIKTWDVNVPASYAGYCGANGSHAKIILEAVRGYAAVVVERTGVQRRANMLADEAQTLRDENTRLKARIFDMERGKR